MTNCIGVQQAGSQLWVPDQHPAAGSIYSRGGYAECGTLLSEETQAALAACEGLVLKVRGDAHNYTCFLTTGKPPAPAPALASYLCVRTTWRNNHRR